jgi:hypothetical protein
MSCCGPSILGHNILPLGSRYVAPQSAALANIYHVMTGHGVVCRPFKIDNIAKL